MRNAIKFILAVATAIILMLVVRAYAFTIYKVSNSNLNPVLKNSNLNPVLKKNDRVLVNKLDRARFLRGDIVVFSADSSYVGVVSGVPGDTVTLDSTTYVLPERCGCQECQCKERAVFLIWQGKEQALIHKDDIIGKAYKLTLTGK